jgi:hypothetical protein
MNLFLESNSWIFNEDLDPDYYYSKETTIFTLYNNYSKENMCLEIVFSIIVKLCRKRFA